MKIRLAGWLAVAVLATGLSVVCVDAQDTEPGNPKIDADAVLLLKQMGDYLAGVKEFSFNAEVTSDELAVGNQKIQFTDHLEVALRRPNKLWVDTRGDLFKKRLWYNGKTVTIMSYLDGFYTTTKVPSKLDAMLDEMMDAYGVTNPVIDFIVSNPYDVLLADVTSAVYVGLHPVDGTLCNHLAFTKENVDWQIWIEDGSRHVPRKFVVTYKLEPGSPQDVVIMDDWDFSIKHPDHLFEFRPPQGAREIELLPLAEM